MYMYGNYSLCPGRKKKTTYPEGFSSATVGGRVGKSRGRGKCRWLASWWLVQSAKPKKKTKASKNKTRECKHLHARTNQNINKTKIASENQRHVAPALPPPFSTFTHTH